MEGKQRKIKEKTKNLPSSPSSVAWRASGQYINAALDSFWLVWHGTRISMPVPNQSRLIYYGYIAIVKCGIKAAVITDRFPLRNNIRLLVFFFRSSAVTTWRSNFSAVWVAFLKSFCHCFAFTLSHEMVEQLQGGRSAVCSVWHFSSRWWWWRPG